MENSQYLIDIYKLENFITKNFNFGDNFNAEVLFMQRCNNDIMMDLFDKTNKRVLSINLNELDFAWQENPVKDSSPKNIYCALMEVVEDHSNKFAVNRDLEESWIIYQLQNDPKFEQHEHEITFNRSFKAEVQRQETLKKTEELYGEVSYEDYQENIDFVNKVYGNFDCQLQKKINIINNYCLDKIEKGK